MLPAAEQRQLLETRLASTEAARLAGQTQRGACLAVNPGAHFLLRTIRRAWGEEKDSVPVWLRSSCAPPLL